jgi:dTMP kinase
MDPNIALARGLARQSGEDRFEDMGLAFQETLRHGFLSIAAAHPKRCVLIDGNREPSAVATEIAAHVADRTDPA